MEVAKAFLTRAFLVDNAVKGEINVMEALEVGKMSVLAPALCGVACVPHDFPDYERVEKISIAKLQSATLKAPFQLFYDEDEALKWLVNRVSDD